MLAALFRCMRIKTEVDRRLKIKRLRVSTVLCAGGQFEFEQVNSASSLKGNRHEVVMGGDPDSLQDFCVADRQGQVSVNGFSCKDPKMVSAEDFFFGGLRRGDTNNAVGFNVTAANVNQIPGLNTLGISLVRIDYAVDGIIPPHTHPRASEILVLLKGQLLVGFIDTTNKFYSKVLKKGDVFVFPKGLLHFQQNVGERNAVAIAALSSQNPGIQVTANSLFAANPPMPDGVLTKAFRSDKTVVDFIQGKLMQ
ncbi:putative germin-like protein 2-3 [Cryptomeria japonica]|uniref:putative germin-like protein 2-3 n=1 Tax=Cryptomeria japonica TaxID=3369 RepID=UPI0027DA9956|nr:putative germin-like protein 2-3 [Cryptomeria japonica]